MAILSGNVQSIEGDSFVSEDIYYDGIYGVLIFLQVRPSCHLTEA